MILGGHLDGQSDGYGRQVRDGADFHPRLCFTKTLRQLSKSSNLGWAYESGLGVPKDCRESITWYRKAAGNGNLLALRRLDRLSESGGTWSALVHLLGF